MSERKLPPPWTNDPVQMAFAEHCMATHSQLVEALEKARHEIGAARIHSNHRIFFEHARKAQAIIEAALSAAKEPHHD